MHEFTTSWAVVIGINEYTHGVPKLRSAVNDAQLLARVLQDQHGYQVLLRDHDVTRAALDELLTTTLPALVGPNDRLLFYFAGHGVALDDPDDTGPAGYLLPQDARSQDHSGASYFSMQTLYQALAPLPCRHLLLILDCCFAGAFRWSTIRGTPVIRYGHLYPPRYERFLREPAWQVLTSAAYNQTAADVVLGLGVRDPTRPNSPFAQALAQALTTAHADLSQPHDWVVTATELYRYLRDQLEVGSSRPAHFQTPGLWPLPRQRTGEYLFLVPGHTPDLPPALPLDAAHNPYMGLRPYEQENKDLYFGREQLVQNLTILVPQQPLTVILGASGTGKSSLARAGLVPRLTAPTWQILGPIRPGANPLITLTGLVPGELEHTLAERIHTWRTRHPAAKLLLVIDQFEELITLCREDTERQCFLDQVAGALNIHHDITHVVVTLRADFEPQFTL